MITHSIIFYSALSIKNSTNKNFVDAIFNIYLILKIACPNSTL